MNWRNYLFPKIRHHSYNGHCPISISIQDKAFLKLIYYTKNIDEEIAGLLVVEKNGTFLHISDVILLNQEVSSGDVELSKDALLDFTDEMADKNPEILPKIKGWYHSHNFMNTFWSGTDDEAFKTLLGFSRDYCIGVVTSKQHHFRFRVDVETTNFGTLSFDNVPYKIIYGEYEQEVHAVNGKEKQVKTYESMVWERIKQ